MEVIDQLNSLSLEFLFPTSRQQCMMIYFYTAVLSVLKLYMRCISLWYLLKNVKKWVTIDIYPFKFIEPNPPKKWNPAYIHTTLPNFECLLKIIKYCRLLCP